MSVTWASQPSAAPPRRFLGRPLRRLLLALALSVSALAVTTSGAFAGRLWCPTDPVVIINGNVADVFVSSTVLASLSVTGPTQVVITVPDGVSTLGIPDLGFLRGEVLTFKHSSDLQVTPDGIQMQIAVYVPAGASLPVKVDFAPRILGILWPSSAIGTSNQWITLKVLF